MFALQAQRAGTKNQPSPERAGSIARRSSAGGAAPHSSFVHPDRNGPVPPAAACRGACCGGTCCLSSGSHTRPPVPRRQILRPPFPRPPDHDLVSRVRGGNSQNLIALDQMKNLGPARSIQSPYSGSGGHDAPPPARLPGKGEKPNAKVTDTFTNGVVPAPSRPYYVDNENGGDSVEAHVDRAVAAARSKMVVTVECLLLPVNWVTKETHPRPHSGKYWPVHRQVSGLERVLLSDSP
jgi:hypothetical protein